MNDETDLRAENRALTEKLIKLTFAQAIASGRITPAEEYRFSKKYGASATLADAEGWIADAPAAPSFVRSRGRPTSSVGANDGSPGSAAATGARRYESPDAEIVGLARDLVREADAAGKVLSFKDAVRRVFTDPQHEGLCREYLAMFGQE